MYYLLWYIFSYLVCHFVYQHKWFIEQTYIFCPVDVSTTEARENIILQPIHKVSLCFYNPHSHPCGCYGVTNGRKPSLLIAGGLHHTFWGEFKFLFCGPKHQLINVCYLITNCWEFSGQQINSSRWSKRALQTEWTARWTVSELTPWQSRSTW